MQMELDGKDFYLEIESRVDNKGLKSIFSILAGDEQKHYEVLKELRDKQPPMEQTTVLENIIEFVSRPSTWLENAEFFHLDEY